MIRLLTPAQFTPFKHHRRHGPHSLPYPQVGDELHQCSAVVLKAGKEGQYEAEGYGQRPYDNWDRIMVDCTGLVRASAWPSWGLRRLSRARALTIIRRDASNSYLCSPCALVGSLSLTLSPPHPLSTLRVRAQEFKTVMSALKSNNERWGFMDVTLVLRRAEAAAAAPAAAEQLQ